MKIHIYYRHAVTNSPGRWRPSWFSYENCFKNLLKTIKGYDNIDLTLALDGDPLDVLVLINEPTFPGCVMEVKPIGVFHMADDKGPDEKVICVPVSYPIWNKLNDLSDVNPHLIKEIEHFFQVYKDLENKQVDVEGWGNVKEAKEIYVKCKNRFEEIQEKPEGLFSIK
jgi:inorganic pyrophosphatase